MTVVRDLDLDCENQDNEESKKFPIFLHNMPHVETIREMIKIHPALLFLFYKFATTEIILDVVKSPILLYHQKKGWFNGLIHLRRLGLVSFEGSDIHRIQPENVHFTKDANELIILWKFSDLFNGFKWLESNKTEIFRS